MTSQQLPAVRRGAARVHREEVRAAADQGDGDQVPDDALQVGDKELHEGQAHTDAEAGRRAAVETDSQAEEGGTRAIIDTTACFMPFFFKAFLFFVMFFF